MPEIGATLREARMRTHIDVSEIEAQTKIRAKYLRALENEEWGLLPGPTFVKSFLRTYAQALQLDAKALVEEYRLHHESPSESALEPIVSTPQRTSGRSRGRTGSADGPSRGYVVAVGVVGLLIVLLIVLLISGGGKSTSTTKTSVGVTSHTHSAHPGSHGKSSSPVHGGAAASSNVVALSLKASAVVYVCLLGEGGRKLIPGTDLGAGQSTPTFHAKRFEITLGNSSVTMFIDGHARSVAPSSQAIGFSLTKARGRRSLSAGELPTCQ
jgi:cytoskeleton protein RodZ